MKTTILCAVSTLLLAGACSKEGGQGAQASSAEGGGAGAGGCPALKITVDGQPLDGMTRGLAYTMVSGSYRTEMVDLFNKDEVKCAEVMAPSRSPLDGEVMARAFGGPAQGLGLDAYTHIAAKATDVTAKAGKVGDKMTICVKETSFTPNAGRFEGENVTVSGAFTGEYCGEKQ
jgi:hypothetical protein